MRLIPAHAGSTGSGPSGRSSTPAHPRSRGEHTERSPLESLKTGSSPLTRGAHRNIATLERCRRLIPAHAGSTDRRNQLSPPFPAHPRSRGEHCIEVLNKAHPAGSSPLTRGAPAHAWRVHLRGGLIPAHAGSTQRVTWWWLVTQAHPRSRGEHKRLAALVEAKGGSSPLTRGARARNLAPTTWGRLIPAHAGSTAALCLV